jgi:hypothetical protein
MMMTSPTTTAHRILLVAMLAAGAYGAACNSSGRSSDAGGGTSGGGSGGTGGNPNSACAGTLNGSCRFNSTLGDCRDYYGLPDTGAVAAIEAMCEEDATGTWTAGAACSRTGVLGGCAQTQGGPCLVWWTYTGSTVDELMSACADDMGTWVNP